MGNNFEKKVNIKVKYEVDTLWNKKVKVKKIYCTKTFIWKLDLDAYASMSGIALHVLCIVELKSHYFKLLSIINLKTRLAFISINEWQSIILREINA